MDIQCESANHVRWNVGQGQRCNEPHFLDGIQWQETIHGNLTHVETESSSKTNWKVLEDLG